MGTAKQTDAKESKENHFGFARYLPSLALVINSVEQKFWFY